MNIEDDIEECGEAAIIAVNDFIGRYHAAAIPALIGACVMWACENGGGDVVRGTLKSARALSNKMEREIRKGAN